MRERFDIAVLEKELQAKPEQNYSQDIIKAINNNDEDTLAELFSGEVDINQLIEHDGSKLTPLMYAASIGNLAMLEFLLSCDADINLENENGSALYYAIVNENIPCLQKLLAENACCTYFHNSVQNSYIIDCAKDMPAEMFKILVEHFVCIGQQN